MAGKTSTFTIHHDRCDPNVWTLAQWQMLRDFIKDPQLTRAAGLSRLGIQLIVSEHHEPAGGTLEFIGWAAERGLPRPDNVSEDLDDVTDGEDLTPIAEIYRGPTRYAARFLIGDGNGDVDGHEYEIRETEVEAKEFLKSLTEEEPA